MKFFIEAKDNKETQNELVVGKIVASDLLGRFDENDEIMYDIAVVNPAVLDLIDVLQTSEGTPLFKGMPLSSGEANFVVVKGDKTIPIGQVQFVPEPAIGAAIIKFERIDDTSELSGYVLGNFELLGIINLIDTRNA